MSQEKVIDDIPVAYVAKQGHPASVASKAFWELEQQVPLQGNKFYGVFDGTNEYRACVELNDKNREAAKNLEHGVIKGGKYAYEILAGDYNSIIKRIGAAFETLSSKYQRDLGRPNVEFYCRHTEIVVMLPIK